MSEITLRPEVEEFAEAMELALRDNDHKGGWEDCNANYLIGRLREETVELEDALWGHGNRTGNKDIRREAADVANFAMMIFDKAKRKQPTT